MNERQTIFYVVPARPQAPPPPIQPPAKQADPWDRASMIILVFVAGLVIGALAIVSNQPLPPGNPGPAVKSPANPPTFAGPSR